MQDFRVLSSKMLPKKGCSFKRKCYPTGMNKEMTIQERQKYLKMMQKRYQKADKPGKAALLDEMEVITDMHRKSLIRSMNRKLERRKRKRERGVSYGIEVEDAIRVISESYDYICPERIIPNIISMAKQLEAHGELKLTPELETHLSTISVSTYRRKMQRIQQYEPRLPRKKPSKPNRIARQIPIQRIAWDESEPGHFEIDLVHHSGPEASGQYVHTLQMIDVATGWSERVAMLGRSKLVMKDGFQRIFFRLPFKVKEFHCDNGSEFINDVLYSFWKDAVPDAAVTRSRRYRKNDNRFVEQKNSSLVRAYFGNDRYDTVEATNLLNQIYDKMWLYYNFFQPVMRLAEKQELIQNGKRRIKRVYDIPQTPYQRLKASGILSDRHNMVTYFDTLIASTNPRTLRKEIYELRKELFRLPSKEPYLTEDVRLTLLPAVSSHPLTPIFSKMEAAFQ